MIETKFKVKLDIELMIKADTLKKLLIIFLFLYLKASGIY